MRLVLIALCLSLVAPVSAAEILNFPKLKPKAMSVQPAGIPAACKEWTDSCRICALSDKGEAACSNVGIACLPDKWRCTRP